MKHIYKLAAIVIALLAMLAISACSSEEPNDNKGRIDTDFLSALARGDVSVTLCADSIATFEKEYDVLNGIDGEWREVIYDGWGSRSFTIADGKALFSLDLMDFSSGASILKDPWDIYCDETGCDKFFEIAHPFVYDAEKNTITINSIIYDVEETDKKEIILSFVRERPTIHGKPGLLKFVRGYVVKPNMIDLDRCLLFDSKKDAKIAMVKMFRAYFGDILNLNDFEKKYHDRLKMNPIIDLAALEDDLVNDRGEWYSWNKATYGN